jgi:hypothetical protein
MKNHAATARRRAKMTDCAGQNCLGIQFGRPFSR